MSLKDIALPLIQRGIRVVPARPGERASTLPNWPDIATTDPAKIEEWDKQYPDWNLVCVSNLEDVCIVDVDNLEAALKMGMPAVPDTFTVKSPKGYHVYFQHTEESRKLGPRTARNGVGTIAEFKDTRKSCCAPGCTRADGKKYVVCDSSPLTPIPQEYVDWFRAVDPKERPHDARSLHEDFDFEEFCDFYGLETMGSGPWYYLRECPVKGDCHTNGGKPDYGATAVYYDENLLGFKCLAQSCEGASMSIGGLMKYLNAQKGERYPGKVWEEEELDPSAFAEDIEETPEAAPAKDLEPEQPAEPKQIVSAADFAEIMCKLKYPELQFPYDALPAGRFKMLVDKACEGGMEPGLVVPAIIALASAIPAQDRMDGDRINHFVCLLALVGAGKDMAMNRAETVLGMDEEEGRLVTHYTPSGERSVAVLLGDKLGTKTDPGRKPGFPRHCIITPELEETLKKSRSETSGVLQAMQYFYDKNLKTFTDTRHDSTTSVNCRLSWLTALPVGNNEIDTDSFKQAFGENTAHGIASRFIYGFSEKRIDPRRMRHWSVPRDFNNWDKTGTVETDLGPMQQDVKDSLISRLRSAKVEGWEPGVEQQYLDWAPERDMSGRDFQHVHKIAVMTALLNDHKLISQGDWDFAVEFMNWQTAIRQTFSTGRAKKVTQAEFNEVVVDAVTRRAQKLIQNPKTGKHTKILELPDGNKQYYVRWNALSNDLEWYKYGMDVEKTIDGLVRSATLAYMEELEPSANGDGKDKLVPNKKWVRRVNLHRFIK